MTSMRCREESSACFYIYRGRVSIAYMDVYAK